MKALTTVAMYGLVPVPPIQDAQALAARRFAGSSRSPLGMTMPLGECGHPPPNADLHVS